MSKLNLAAVAVIGTARRSGVYTLSIEEARKAVTVVDANKMPDEKGGQFLKAKYGRYNLTLNFVKKDTTGLEVTKEQVEDYSKAIIDHALAGDLDAEILDAQDRGQKAAEAVKANAGTKAANTPVETAEDAVNAGVDLDALEDDVEELGDLPE